MKRIYFFITTIIIVLSMLNITVYAAEEKALTYINSVEAKRIDASLNITAVYATEDRVLTYVNLVGANRYDTSILVSKEAYPKGSNNIVLVNGTTNIDAILAEPLANKLSAPVLRNPKDKLMKEIKDEIKRLKPKNAYIIGGEAAMSKNIEVELKRMSIKVERIYGDNRYTTAIAIAKQLNNFDKIIICNSSNDAQNAMAISAKAAENKIPILYNDNKNEINEVTFKFISLHAEKIKEIYMVGNSISQIQKLYFINRNSDIKIIDINGNNSYKINGIERINIKENNPYDINVEITEAFEETYDKVVLVNNPVDAVSISYLAAKNKCLFLYTDKMLTKTQEDLVKRNNISKIYYSGGGTIKDTADQVARIICNKQKGITKLSGIPKNTEGSYLNGTRLISNGLYCFPEYHQLPGVGDNYTRYEKISYGDGSNLRRSGCNVFASSCVVSGLLGDSSVEPISYLNKLKELNIYYKEMDTAFCGEKTTPWLESTYGLTSTKCKSEAEMLKFFKSKKGNCAAVGYEYGHYIAIIPIMNDPEGYKFYVVDSANGHTGKYKSGKDYIEKTRNPQFGVCAVIYQK